MNALLDQVFDNFGLLVVGWSGEWDTALRDAIVRAPSRRYPFYWASRGDLGGLAKDLLQQRGGRSFPITDADSFFVKLRETLEVLRQASRPHPQSVELAVALAKRYCRDDKFALEWAEFLHSEVEKVRRYVSGPDYPDVAPTNESLNRIVDAFMARTEVIRRACLICGRWGTVDANQAVARAIQALSFRAQLLQGRAYEANGELREFGASICFYWNTAGLLDRGDWRAIRGLQEVSVNWIGDKRDAVMALPFSVYSDVGGWKFLRGLERHHTPISVYLAARFAAEARDITLSRARADELFDQTELAIALGYAHKRLKSGRGCWMPTGRFFWKDGGTIFLEELKRIEALPESDPLFRSGMLGEDKSAAVATLQEVRAFHKKVAPTFFW
jgi:hypothetical protein